MRRLLRQAYHFVRSFATDPDFRMWCALCLRYGGHPRYQPFQFSIHGLRLTAADSASLLSMAQEIYVEKIYDFKASTSRPRIVDVGANIGLASLRWLQFYPEAQILAIEADPNVAKILQGNIDAAHAQKQVRVLTGAAWTQEGTINFSMEGADGGRIGQGSKVNGSVPSFDLKEILQAMPEIDFLKMDIEGAESAVFPHIQDMLAKTKNVFLEYHESQQPFLSQILALLEKAGFSYHLEPLQPLGSYFNRNLKSLNRPFQNQINIWASKTGFQ